MHSVYPRSLAFTVVVLVSPLFTPSSSRAQCQLAKILPPDGQSGDHFGATVDMDGDRLIVGAPCNSRHGTCTGTAYVYRRAGTEWRFETRLVPSAQSLWGDFGTSVSIKNNLVLVTAPQHQHAFVFRRTNGTWMEESRLPENDPSPRFGRPAALSESHALVEDDYEIRVFRRMGPVWSELREMAPPIGDRHGKFGASVAADRETAVVGKTGSRTNAIAGVVFVYDLLAYGTSYRWTPEASLTSTHPEDGFEFGAGSAIDGDTILVGTPSSFDGGDRSGAAYVYRFNGEWVEESRLKASDAAANDRFGSEVAIFGDYAAVVARDSNAGEATSGAAYIFQREPDQWRQLAKLVADQDSTEDGFAASLTIGHGAVVVGAPYDDTLGQDAGAVYIFGIGDDCNGNGQVDICEIARNSLPDCGDNVILDECEPDCNANGSPDGCDLDNGTSVDCNIDGIPDECSTIADADGDGTEDCLDACPNDPLKVERGVCDCGTPDADWDFDGTPDCLDRCREDRYKIDPGVCGCDEPETDVDGDGIPDCAAIVNLVPVSAEGLHVISGNNIRLTHGGQNFTVEIYFSNWSPNGESLRAYQVDVDEHWFGGGESGEVRILDDRRPCLTDLDCIDLGVACFNRYCETRVDFGPGAFLEFWRIDFVFRGGMNMGGIDYHVPGIVRIGSVLQASSLPWVPPPRYAGTLVLKVSDDAVGTFTIGFPRSIETSVQLMDKDNQPVKYVVVPATITVTPTACGNGMCELGEDEYTCWVDCTDSEIPTVSSWSLLALTLGLLTGAKIAYRNQRRTSSASG